MQYTTEHITNDVKCSALHKILQMTYVSALHYRKQNGVQNLLKVQGKNCHSQHSYSVGFIVLHVSIDVQSHHQEKNTGAVHQSKHVAQ